MKYSIIIPAFNEEKNISILINKLNNIIKSDKEIIVVDDGSSDNTSKIALEKDARLIRHPYNIGNGAAIKTGIREAKGEILIFMDADGQHPPEEVLKLIKEVDSYDMVIGARDINNFSFGRKLANKIFNLFASYVTGKKILDLTSGFRVVKKNVVRNYLYLLPNTFSYPATLTLSFLKSGRRIKFVKTKAEKREKGRSKISPFKDGVRFLLIIAKIATIYSPFRVFLPISILFFLLGFGYYSYTYLVFHRFTNMSLLLFTTSLQI
jgi:glycosyltransferase involved in cell wall biosynthesis